MEVLQPTKTDRSVTGRQDSWGKPAPEEHCKCPSLGLGLDGLCNLTKKELESQ